MKRIAVLTSGGDAPGMNAAIRAVVRTATERGVEPVGVRHGYAGLDRGDFSPLTDHDVADILHRGGTILGSARSGAFTTEAGQQRAVEHLARARVGGLVVIGGNGSQRGAWALSCRGVPVAGVASTIDNDLYGSDITIGVDTALSIALEAIDRLRTTAAAHHRAFLLEVMGRDCGYLALMAGLAGGADVVVIPESEIPPAEVIVRLETACRAGKGHALVVVGATFVKTQFRARSVYVLHDKTVYGQGVAEFFRDTARKLGMRVVGFEGTEEKSNFDPIITPLKARNPDVVYFGGIYNQAGVFLKQLREKGVKATFLGPDGMDSSEFASIAGKAAVGAYYTTVAGPPTFYPAAKKFVADYKKKFGKDPEPFAAQAYDSTAIVLKAIERAAAGGKKPERKAIVAEVRKTRGYTGLTGTVTFDEKGDPVRTKYFILQITSDDPKKWGENRLVRTLEIAAPKMKKT